MTAGCPAAPGAAEQGKKAFLGEDPRKACACRETRHADFALLGGSERGMDVYRNVYLHKINIPRRSRGFCTDG